MNSAVSLVVLSCLLTGVQCLSNGAPPAACDNISPDPSASGHNAMPQTSTVPYALTGLPPNGNYTPGMSYTLTLAGNANEMFRGFLVVAMSGVQRVGSFNPGANGQVACADSRGVTHTNNNDKTTVSFTWTAPPVGTGEVEVRFAVVMVRQTYWANRLADTLQEAQPEPEPSTSSVTTSPSPSPVIVSSSTSSVAGGDVTFTLSLSPTATPGGSGSNSAPSNIAGSLAAILMAAIAFVMVAVFA